MHLGWEKLKAIGFAFIFILTMFPLPSFLYNKISVNLKLISSQLGVAMMQLCGMSAYREGNVIGYSFAGDVDIKEGSRFKVQSEKKLKAEKLKVQSSKFILSASVYCSGDSFERHSIAVSWG